MGALAAAFVIACTAAFWQGVKFSDGRHAVLQAKAQAATFMAAELASRREAERLAAQSMADQLARELEDMANADPASGCGLPSGRVLRLNRY